MNKRRLIKASLWTTALSPFFFASCVDDSYDLTKDIDMTITVGGDLSIPGSGTEEFTLEEIMDLEDNSVVKTDAQGNYALNKADTTETDVEIDPVHINAPASNPTTTTLYFNTPAATSEEVEAEVNDVTTDFIFSKDDVTTDIVSLTSANVDFTANLTLSFSQTSQNVDVITLKKGFNIEMTLEGQSQPNGLVFELGDPENYGIKAGEAQTIEFKNDQEIRKGETLRIPVHFKRIQNFPEGQGIYQPGHFKLQTNVIANGTATTPGVPAGNIQVNLITDSHSTVRKSSGYTWRSSVENANGYDKGEGCAFPLSYSKDIFLNSSRFVSSGRIRSNRTNSPLLTAVLGLKSPDAI